MDETVAKALLKGLLARLDADSRRSTPLFDSLVSPLDREALVSLLNDPSISNSHEPVLRPNEGKEQSATEIRINPACLSAKPSDKYVVCLDFGTAKSKAFACTASQYRDDELSAIDLIDLGIGSLDQDPDSAYTIESTVWISDDGRMYAGAQAMRLGKEWSSKGKRSRLDSIKQYITLGEMNEKNNEPLPAQINPTAEALTHGEAACFFMAYLNDIAGLALTAQGMDRYTRRRFTVPAWESQKRRDAVSAIAGHIMMSQIVADTFSGRWEQGVPIPEYKRVLEACKNYQGQLSHLLDSVTNEGIGRSEPVAAGAARLLAEKSLGRLLLMIDIGAGTTDFALLRVMPPNMGGFVSPIVSSRAVNRAGDRIDTLLIEEIVSKAPVAEDQISDVKRGIRSSGIRSHKKSLLEFGEVTVTLVTHDVVNIRKEDFLSSKGISEFRAQLKTDVQEFLNSVDLSYAPLVEKPIMIISGGSAKLPFLIELYTLEWTLAGVRTKFDPPRKSVPAAFSKFTETDLSQLAVAIGGAVSDVNEREINLTYQGAIRPPALGLNPWV